MLEEVIYTRLSEDATLAGYVGDRIYPTEPSENTQLPFVVYTVSAAEPNLTMSGASSLTKYTVDVDVWAETAAVVLNVMGAVKNLMHVWIGSSLKSFLGTQGTDQQDIGYHGNQSYNVWWAGAEVV